MVEAFGVTSGNVASYALIKSETREQAEGPRQTLFTMLAFLLGRSKVRGSGNVERVLGGHSHGDLLVLSGQL
jgi:hypothetical protein